MQSTFLARKSGNHPSIQTVNPDYIRIVEKSEFDDFWFGWCNDASRSYFYVLENGYQWNHASAYYCLPPNICCHGTDSIYTTYFDRGIYDRQDCVYRIGCRGGDPVIVPNDIKYVCCCQECTLCSWNGWGLCCGGLMYLLGCDIPDRLRFSPYEYHCCGLCYNRASWCTNCCSLCGPKTGEPIILLPLLRPQQNCLKKGTAESMALAMNNSKEEWNKRARAY